MKILKSIKVMGVVFLLGLIFLLASCGESSKTVVFKDYDGAVLKEELVNHGKSAIAPKDPIRKGYSFIGWDVEFSKVESNLEVVALYEINSYEVVFKDSEGTLIKTDIVDYGKRAITPEAAIKEGYTFIGWYYGLEEFDKKFTNQDIITNDVVIYAIYEEIITYNVDFITNTNIEVDSQVIEIGNKVKRPAVPIKEGYTFKGWYINNDELWVFGEYLVTEDIVLEAKWKANEYMITYDSNGGTLNSNTQKVFYADGYTLKEPTREGYTFKGWYIDNNKIEDGIWNIASNKTLVAKWEANKYQINYDISDELMEQTQIVMYDNQYELITPKREDFIFIGWYYNNILFTNGIWNLLNDITLTPKWSLENITLSGETYIYNGEVRSLEIEGKLPEGIEVDYINNDKVNAGDYQVTAKFVDTTGIIENIESLYANLVIKILQAPQNVSINNGILSWDEVEGAVSYKVIVNDIEYITTNTYYNFSTVDTINIYVISINGNGQSDKAGIIYVENGKTYINYGKYPQTVVSDYSLILALNNLTETNSEGYYKYDGNEYAKLKATPYRSTTPLGYYSSSYKFSDDTTVVSGTTYYFKVEPIKWRIISNNDGTIQLLSEYIIDSQYYHPNTNTRTIGGKTIYSNNYEHSYIRQWLNNSFYNKAFGTLDQNAILTTLVDNSASTTSSSSNSYASNNTNDKIYLLSYQDSINSNYGFSTSTSSNNTRYAVTTDYARAKGAYIDTSTNTYGNGLWWLRSPRSTSSNGASIVYIDGRMDNGNVNGVSDAYYVYDLGSVKLIHVYYSYYSARPALQIK